MPAHRYQHPMHSRGVHASNLTLDKYLAGIAVFLCFWGYFGISDESTFLRFYVLNQVVLSRVLRQTHERMRQTRLSSYLSHSHSPTQARAQSQGEDICDQRCLVFVISLCQCVALRSHVRPLTHTPSSHTSHTTYHTLHITHINHTDTSQIRSDLLSVCTVGRDPHHYTRVVLF